MGTKKRHNRSSQARARGRQATFEREKALEIALDLFWRHGYEGVSISALTEAIGIAAPSLYHAFGSKEALYKEVISRYQGVGLSAAQIAACSSSFEATRRVLEFGVTAVTGSKGPLGCMVSSGLLMASPQHIGVAVHLRKERAKLRAALQKSIEKDVRSGELDVSANAASLARFYTTVLQGMSVQAIDGATQAELTAVMETALLSWPQKNKRLD
jgi:TetR/AcrR family transcriptional regulator, copper-responsive repressor